MSVVYLMSVEGEKNLCPAFSLPNKCEEEKKGRFVTVDT